MRLVKLIESGFFSTCGEDEETVGVALRIKISDNIFMLFGYIWNLILYCISGNIVF
jgi:hypothetical protein